MLTIEIADTDHAAGICRVGTESWRDAYASLLPAEYIEANIRLRYDTERIAGQIDGGDDADGIGEWLVALDRGADRADGGDRRAPDAANERIIGVVRDDRPEPGVGEISDLYIHPDRQGEGIGTRLLSALTGRQREDDTDEQHTYVFADNDAAIGFYESNGFAAEERFRAATVDDVDPDCEAIRFVRSL